MFGCDINIELSESNIKNVFFPWPYYLNFDNELWENNLFQLRFTHPKIEVFYFF